MARRGSLERLADYIPCLIRNKTMELAQLLITPGTLLAAFIFFWKQAKTGREELRRELKSDMRELKSDMKELKTEFKTDMKA